MPERGRACATGAVVVITGAAGGIGRALARRWAKSGARLGLLDLDPQRLDRLAEELKTQGTEVLAIRCDVTREEDCREAMRALVERFASIDVLINNAGITHLSPLPETDSSVVRRVMEVNFFGALHCVQAAFEPLVASQGLVIVTSSVAGFAPLAERCAYSASKHALHGLFETLRSEQLGSGLDVLMVCPGFTRTDIESSALGSDLSASPRPRNTFGRSVEPEEVAEAVFRAARRRRHRIILTPVGKISWILTTFWPALYEKIMARRMKTDETAETAKGMTR